MLHTRPRKSKPSFLIRRATSSRRKASSGFTMRRLRSTNTALGGSTTLRVGWAHGDRPVLEHTGLLGARSRRAVSRHVAAAAGHSLNLRTCSTHYSAQASTFQIPAAAGDGSDRGLAAECSHEATWAGARRVGLYPKPRRLGQARVAARASPAAPTTAWTSVNSKRSSFAA